MKYFGTDGIRGELLVKIDDKIAYSLGKALALKTKGANILIGSDTRTSKDYLTHAFTVGAIAFGATVTDVQVVPTAGISYLTSLYKFDYGVVVSASHSPYNHNGIKIFDYLGQKLCESDEQYIEQLFEQDAQVDVNNLGSYCQKPLINQYIKFLVSCIDVDLKGLKVALDLSNGAAYTVAPQVFKKLGAEVHVIHNRSDGKNINHYCGALYPQSLQNYVLNKKCDVGFAYDGDSDRLICVDSFGKTVDGDKLIYILANYYKKNKKLVNNAVVGTIMTNLAIDKALEKNKIKLLRSDVGDKYVIRLMRETGAVVGGEQSGHIILADLLGTGDGILASLVLSKIIKKHGCLSKLFNVDLINQKTVNFKVKNKNQVMKNKKLTDYADKLRKDNSDLRLILRQSGTEELIRLTVEHNDMDYIDSINNEFKQIIESIE